MTKKVTIKDVASTAGVSISTVSRVINGYTVKEELKNKVQSAIEELEFHPNESASALRSGKSKNIGLIISRLDSVTMMRIARGIEKIIEKEGYTLVIASTGNDQEKELSLIRTFMQGSVDAVVLASSLTDYCDIENVISPEIPLVLIDRRIRGARCDMIIEDNYESSFAITKYAIQHGHKRIAFLKGLPGMQVTEDRFNGYYDALRQYGLIIDEKLILQSKYSRESAYMEVDRLLGSTPRQEWPTLIYASNILTANGAMDSIYKRGLRIPEDISLAVYGDMDLPPLSPQITCIRQPSEEMGKETGTLVLDLIHDKSNNRPAITKVIKCELIEGNTIKDIDIFDSLSKLEIR